MNLWRAVGVVMAVGLLGMAGKAFADGLPQPWEINFQAPFSPVMERVHQFHTLLLVVIFGIVLLVLGLLAYVILRFNAKRNPVPSKTTHNTLLEVLWTGIPIAILVIIAIPSIKLLYFSSTAQDYDMTLKVTGHQWYWTYDYPDQGGFSFDSIPLGDDELQPGQPRLLTVDNKVVLPINTTVQVLITSDDVIHNWAVPSLGLKKDALPGRVNETWVRITKEGTYYGMCSELCGVNHYFMPIEVQAVSKDEFDAWVKKAQEDFAGTPAPTVAGAQVASN